MAYISGLRVTSKYDQILVGIDIWNLSPKLPLGNTNGQSTRDDPGSTILLLHLTLWLLHAPHQLQSKRYVHRECLVYEHSFYVPRTTYVVRSPDRDLKEWYALCFCVHVQYTQYPTVYLNF